MTMFQQPMLNQKKTLSILLSDRHEPVTLGLMILLLQLALYQPVESRYLVSALLFAHIGFFLLWQPALNATRDIHLTSLVTITLLNISFYLLLGNWFLALWIILLIGLTSGSALVNGMLRTLYALATVILFLQLSLVLTPRLFDFDMLDKDIDEIIFYIIFIACGIIIVWPLKKVRTIKVDYLHSILISFGLFSFYLISILISFMLNIHYLQSLFMAAISISVFFICISIVWLPRHGISGLGQIWEQHILNIGNPFEDWVEHTALLGKNKKITPDVFLNNSINKLLTLSWICGIFWSNQEQEQLYGEVSHQRTFFKEGDVEMVLYSHIPMGPALKIHAQLLLHLMSYFYDSKLREVTLKNQTHLKAVYETGSKLTHDIKNILQSLQALTGVVQADGDPVESQKLMGKQLPILTQRLQNTLDKLQTKTDTGKSFKSIDVWWEELQSRYHGRNLDFEGNIMAVMEIDTDVFDTVLENLLENARYKRRIHPETKIVTTIKINNKKVNITVCDDGDPMPSERAAMLFKQILPSEDGYGIGLYQSAQLAAKNGYKLTLIENEASHVCFQLASLT